jgi:hypothetical protein
MDVFNHLFTLKDSEALLLFNQDIHQKMNIDFSKFKKKINSKHKPIQFGYRYGFELFFLDKLICMKYCVNNGKRKSKIIQMTREKVNESLEFI